MVNLSSQPLMIIWGLIVWGSILRMTLSLFDIKHNLIMEHVTNLIGYNEAVPTLEVLIDLPQFKIVPVYPWSLSEDRKDWPNIWRKVYDESRMPRDTINIYRRENYKDILTEHGLKIEGLVCTVSVLERPYVETWSDTFKDWMQHVVPEYELKPLNDIEYFRFDVDGEWAPQNGRLSAMSVQCFKEKDTKVPVTSHVFHHFEAPLQQTMMDGIMGDNDGKVSSTTFYNRYRPVFRWEKLAADVPEEHKSYLGKIDVQEFFKMPEWIPMDPIDTDMWNILIIDINGQNWTDQRDSTIIIDNVAEVGVSDFDDFTGALFHGYEQLTNDSLTISSRGLSDTLDVHTDHFSLPKRAFSEGYWTGYLAENDIQNNHSSGLMVEAGSRYTWDINGVELEAARTGLQCSKGDLAEDFDLVMRDFNGWTGFLVMKTSGETMKSIEDTLAWKKIVLEKWLVITRYKDSSGGRSYGISLSDQMLKRYPKWHSYLKANIDYAVQSGVLITTSDIHRFMVGIFRREWPLVEDTLFFDEEGSRDVGTHCKALHPLPARIPLVELDHHIQQVANSIRDEKDGRDTRRAELEKVLGLNSTKPEEKPTEVASGSKDRVTDGLCDSRDYEIPLILLSTEASFKENVNALKDNMNACNSAVIDIRSHSDVNEAIKYALKEWGRPYYSDEQLKFNVAGQIKEYRDRRGKNGFDAVILLTESSMTLQIRVLFPCDGSDRPFISSYTFASNKIEDLAHSHRSGSYLPSLKRNL